MKKTLLLAAIYSILALTGIAQTLTADQVLTKCSATLSDAPALTAKFRATAADKSVEGEMTICQEKFKMGTADYHVWYNGTDMWCYYQSAGETYLSSPTLEELMEINPFVILNGYKNAYHAKLVSSQGGKYTLQMMPLSKTSQIKSATVTIDSASWLPTSVTATFTNNAQVKIAILSTSIANSVPALSTFNYPAKEYSKIEVIDLR